MVNKADEIAINKKEYFKAFDNFPLFWSEIYTNITIHGE